MAITETKQPSIEVQSDIHPDASVCVDSAERLLNMGGRASRDTVNSEWYSRIDGCSYSLSRGYTVDLDDTRPTPRGYVRFEVVECGEVVASYEINRFGLVPTASFYADDRFGINGHERAANLAVLLSNREDHIRRRHRKIKLARASFVDPRRDDECE